MNHLRTEIDISAPPEVVWDVLTDLGRHEEWNPFMVEASGEVVVGSKLRVRMQPVGGKPTVFTPVVTVADSGQVFEWLGSLPIPGLFSGRHRFELTPIPGGTRLVQSESFKGILFPLLAKTIEAKTKPAFEAMDEALKARTEAMVRSGD